MSPNLISLSDKAILNNFEPYALKNMFFEQWKTSCVTNVNNLEFHVQLKIKTPKSYSEQLSQLKDITIKHGGVHSTER